jgi:uncharacterized integral membrane protein
MKKAKIIIILIISLLALVVFVQNRQTVDTKLLFVTITMPRVLLLIITFIMGFVVGIILAGYMLRQPRKAKLPAEKG